MGSETAQSDDALRLGTQKEFFQMSPTTSQNEGLGSEK